MLIFLRFFPFIFQIHFFFKLGKRVWLFRFMWMALCNILWVKRLPFNACPCPYVHVIYVNGSVSLLLIFLFFSFLGGSGAVGRQVFFLSFYFVWILTLTKHPM